MNEIHDISRQISTRAVEVKDRAIDIVSSSARRIKDFVIDSSPRLFPRSPEEFPMEILNEGPQAGAELAVARQYSWAIQAYEKIFEIGQVVASPGPGNGYYETVRLLLEQIEIIARMLGVANDIDRTPYFKFLEKMFPNIPEQTRVLYPAVIYFIALNMKKINETDIKKRRHLNYWQVSVSPSKKTHVHAVILVASCNNMFNLLRHGNEEIFKEIYPEFEKHWQLFLDQLVVESHLRNYVWCPDLEVYLLMKKLHKCKMYPKKVNDAKRIASYFDRNGRKVIKALEKYPRRTENTYENNRAFILAKLCIELASKSLCLRTSGLFYEVKVLNF